MLTNKFVLIKIVVSLELGEIINIYTLYGTKPTNKNEWLIHFLVPAGI